MEIRKITAAEGEKFSSARVIDDGKTIEIISIPESDYMSFDEMFPVINVQKIVNDYRLLSYNPETLDTMRVMESVEFAKKINLPNFRAQSFAPSFADKSENSIIYFKGIKPATGKSAHWWRNVFKEYMPSKNSRLGELLEYDIFLAYLIQRLLDKGYNARSAWRFICNESYNLRTSAFLGDLKHGLRKTGDLQVAKYCDIGGILKLVCTDKYWYRGLFDTMDDSSGFHIRIRDDETYRKKLYQCSDVVGKRGFGYLRDNIVKDEEQPIYWTVGWMVMDE